MTRVESPTPTCDSRRPASIGVLTFLLLLVSPTADAAVNGTDADAPPIIGRIVELEDRGQHVMAVPLYEELLKTGRIDSTLIHRFARTLIVVGDHQHLVDLLSGWLQDHPGDVEAYVRLGRALSQLERGTEALQAWRTALEVSPLRPRLYRQISNLCAATRMTKAAIDVLIDGRKRLGQAALFSWELASLYLVEEAYGRAVDEYFEHLTTNAKRYAAVENRLVSVAADSTRSPRLLQALQDRRRETDTAEMVLLESVCLLEAGVPEQGLELLSEMAAARQQFDPVYRYAARCQALGRDRVAAAGYLLFVEHSESSPHRYRALLQLAAVRGRLGEYVTATAVYTRLAAEYPGRQEAEQALYELGRLQLEIQRDAERATESLTAVLDSSPRGPWAPPALALLAECALAKDDLDRADAYLTQLLHLDAGAATAVRFRRAELSYFRGDFTAATTQLADLLAGDSGHEFANDALYLTLLMESASAAEPALRAYALSQLRLRQGRPTAAHEHWQAMSKYASSDLRQRFILSQAEYHLRLGDGRRALKLYQQLIRLFPNGEHAIEAHLSGARIHEQRGRPRSALQAYETALLAFPEDVRAAEIRLELDRLRQETNGGRRG